MARLTEMLKHDAPDCLIASELELLGKTGRMLDPDGCARRRAVHDEMRAKKYAGICLQHGCDARAEQDDHCGEHQDILSCH